MQESNGCTRVPTTNWGVWNPGLMQSHNGRGTCNDGPGSVQNPCLSIEIIQMIQDGVFGTVSGDGLKQCLTETGVSDVSMYYKAARIYNSGLIDKSGNLGAGVSTNCYVSDIANRLMGWSSGTSKCNPGTIGQQGVPGPGNSSGLSSSRAFVIETLSSSQPLFTYKSPAPLSMEFDISTAIPLLGTTYSLWPISISTPKPMEISNFVYTSTSTASTITIVSVAESFAAGTSCRTEGLWNCIDGLCFQRCASGLWSVMEQLAMGVNCTIG